MSATTAVDITLRRLISVWPTQPVSARRARIEIITDAVTATPDVHRPAAAVATVLAISTLLSRDSSPAGSSDVPPAWSARPGYSEELVVGLLDLLSLVLSPLESTTSPTLPISFAASAAANDINPAPSRAVFRPAFSALSPYALAFLLGEITTLAASEPGLPARRAALAALAALVDVAHPPALAAFVPGLASALVTALRAPRLHSATALPALSALSTLLTRVLPTSRTYSTPSTLADALETLQIQNDEDAEDDLETVEKVDLTSTSKHVIPQTPTVRRDATWVSRIAEQLAPRLALVVLARDGPRTHTRAPVRLSFVRLLSVVRAHTSLTTGGANLGELCTLALIEAADDVASVVAQSARTALTLRSLPLHTLLIESLSLLERSGDLDQVKDADEKQRPERAAAKALADASDDQFPLRLFAGFVAVLFPLDGATLITPARLPAVLDAVGMTRFAEALVSQHRSTWQVCAGEEDTPAPVLSAITRAGATGFLPVLHGALLGLSGSSKELSPDDSDVDLHPFVGRTHALLLHSACVHGALRDGDVAHARSCVIDVLECMANMPLPRLNRLSATQMRCVDDTTLALKCALLNAQISLLHAIADCTTGEQARVGADIALVSLPALLRDAAGGEDVVSQAAIKALNALAEISHCSSIRKLLQRHLNFVLARVIRQLQAAWAGDVLGFVLGSEPDDVSREATRLLRRSLRRLADGLAGARDERVIYSLAAMRSVLHAALALHTKDGVNASDLDEQGKNKDLVDESPGIDEECNMVRRMILRYCIDDIDPADEPPPPPERPRAGDDLFDGFDGDEGEKADGGRDATDVFADVAGDALEGARDLLIGRGAGVRAVALECATLAVRLLRYRKKQLLPHVAQILPMLPDQFGVLDETLERRAVRRNADFAAVAVVNAAGAELPVVAHACGLLAALAECAGSFVNERFVRLVFPRMRRLLRVVRVFPTAFGTFEGAAMTRPGEGGLLASDECLRAVAAVSNVVPDAVAPFAAGIVRDVAPLMDGRNDPGADWVGRGASAVLRRYERERWTRRVQWAEQIIRNVARVHGGETMVALLCCDGTTPDVIRSGSKLLADVVVRDTG